MALPPPYSVAFIKYTDAAPNLAYEVPEGFTAVIRDVTCQTSLGGVIAQVGSQDDEDAPVVWVAQVSTAGVAAYDQWTGRVVVPGGGIISLQLTTEDSGTSVYVGGYLLRGL